MSVFVTSESYRPFKYQWAVEAAKRHSIDMFWDVHQIELQDDKRQYNSKEGLKTKTVSHETNKFIVDHLLLLFTELDKTVGRGYIELLPFIKNNEISNMMLTFAAREVVHQRAYAMAAEEFGFTDTDWSRFKEYAAMRDKLDVMTDEFFERDDRDELKAAIKLAQLSLGEGIGLFAAFAMLLNYKRQGIFMGFNDINQWSLNDEQEHVLNNFRTIAEMRKDLTEVENLVLDKAINKMVDAYVQAELNLIDVMYEKGEQEDLTKADIQGYMHYLGDLRKYQNGLISAGEVRKNPLAWMEWMFGPKHDNFFEKRVTEYSHSGLAGDVDYTIYKDLLDRLL